MSRMQPRASERTSEQASERERRKGNADAPRKRRQRERERKKKGTERGRSEGGIEEAEMKKENGRETMTAASHAGIVILSRMVLRSRHDCGYVMYIRVCVCVCAHPHASDEKWPCLNVSGTLRHGRRLSAGMLSLEVARCAFKVADARDHGSREPPPTMTRRRCIARDRCPYFLLYLFQLPRLFSLSLLLSEENDYSRYLYREKKCDQQLPMLFYLVSIVGSRDI